MKTDGLGQTPGAMTSAFHDSADLSFARDRGETGVA